MHAGSDNVHIQAKTALHVFPFSKSTEYSHQRSVVDTILFHRQFFRVGEAMEGQRTYKSSIILTYLIVL